MDIYREFFPNNHNLAPYDTIEDCIDALERGDVELIMASDHILLSLINYRERSGFKININLNAPLESYFGLNINEAILCSIIEKAQHYVNTDLIEMKWSGMSFDYSKKMAEQRVFYMTIFMSVLVAILIGTVFLFFRNVKLAKKLEEMAHYDALTSICNRRFFMELAGAQIARSLRTGTECFLLIFDLDHFKMVNDTYGHTAGDKVLRDVAQRVKKTIRPYDILGRYGGEEFIVMMSDVKAINKDNVMTAAERIRLVICSTPVEFEGTLIPVAASLGVARAAPVNDLPTAIKCADEALYMAKNQGRNRVIFYEDHAGTADKSEGGESKA